MIQNGREKQTQEKTRELLLGSFRYSEKENSSMFSYEITVTIGFVS